MLSDCWTKTIWQQQQGAHVTPSILNVFRRFRSTVQPSTTEFPCTLTDEVSVSLDCRIVGVPRAARFRWMDRARIPPQRFRDAEYRPDGHTERNVPSMKQRRPLLTTPIGVLDQQKVSVSFCSDGEKGDDTYASVLTDFGSICCNSMYAPLCTCLALLGRRVAR